jgi:hypothetical protein
MTGTEVDLERCGRHEEAIKRLDGWQRQQNGSLQRVEAKVDSLKTWLISVLVAVVVDLGTRLLGGG